MNVHREPNHDTITRVLTEHLAWIIDEHPGVDDGSYSVESMFREDGDEVVVKITDEFGKTRKFKIELYEIL